IFYFFFYCYSAHRYLHSFPTRRSSDLKRAILAYSIFEIMRSSHFTSNRALRFHNTVSTLCWKSTVGVASWRGKFSALERKSHTRSEEHTSELQSRSDLVCRLLLEKKKK